MIPQPLDKNRIDWKTAPFNTQSLLVYCLWYQKDIYVRHFNKTTEKWESTPISEIPGSELLDYLEGWMYKQIYPTRIVEREDKVELPHE